MTVNTDLDMKVKPLVDELHNWLVWLQTRGHHFRAVVEAGGDLNGVVGAGLAAYIGHCKVSGLDY